MNSEFFGSALAFIPLLLIVVIYVMSIRRSKRNMGEMMRINEALLKANLEMVKRLQNIEALLQKDRQD
jgi:preprotein translocase subunit YajC